MNEIPLPQWANILVITVAVSAAIYERLRNAKLNTSAAVNLAKDELVKVLEADRDAWKMRYETEHSEYVARRAGYHDEANTAQVKLLRLTEENAALHAKTDVTPIMAELKSQSEINQKVLKGLDSIISWCNDHEKISANGHQS